MNTRLGTLGLIAALVLSLPARAQDEEAPAEEGSAGGGVRDTLAKNFYFSPLLNYVKSSDARGTDDGFGAQLTLGKGVAAGLNLELTATYAMLDPKVGNGDEATITGVGIGAMVFPSGTLPDLYVPINILRGQVKDNPGPIPDYSTTLVDIGLGYLIPLGGFGSLFPGSALRAELRYRIDAHGRETAGTTPDRNQEFYEGVAAIGLLIPLGAKAAEEPPPAEEPAAEVVPVASGDSDNDGVADDADQCPDTPAGAIVDEKGCERDSDGDGVVDRLDQCPDTPAGSTVNEQGCPADAAPEATPEAAPAGDCIAPSAGEPVDLNGCKTGDTVILNGVNFELNSARLTPNAKTILNGVADALLARTEMAVEIGGHTSSEGSETSNQSLSERRAESVQQYLVGRGVDAGRMTTKGYGEGTPLADNVNEEGRELNRRVELKVTEAGAAAPAEAAAEEPASESAGEQPSEQPAESADAPAEGEAAPAEGGEASLTEAASEAPTEGGDAPAEGEAAPAEAEAPPATEEAPAEEAPAETSEEAPPADDPGAAPEVENAQPG